MQLLAVFLQVSHVFDASLQPSFGKVESGSSLSVCLKASVRTDPVFTHAALVLLPESRNAGGADSPCITTKIEALK